MILFCQKPIFNIKKVKYYAFRAISVVPTQSNSAQIVNKCKQYTYPLAVIATTMLTIYYKSFIN